MSHKRGMMESSPDKGTVFIFNNLHRREGDDVQNNGERKRRSSRNCGKPEKWERNFIEKRKRGTKNMKAKLLKNKKRMMVAAAVLVLCCLRLVEFPHISLQPITRQTAGRLGM